MTTAVAAKKLTKDAKAFLLQALQDIIRDPDFGRSLTKHTQKRLREAETGKSKLISLAAIKRKYS